MTSLARNTTVSVFRVEVSGWDKHEAFFVEKAELQWSALSGKQIALTSAVPDGAVVFLRPFPGLGTNRSASVAYQTEFVGTAPDGRFCVRLHTLHPWTHRHPASHRAIPIH